MHVLNCWKLKKKRERAWFGWLISRGSMVMVVVVVVRSLAVTVGGLTNYHN